MGELFVPKDIKPFHTDYKCPISKEINVNKYNITIDGDVENNQIYLNLGYDNNTQYDCSFFLDAHDAIDLANRLAKYALDTLLNHNLIDYSKNWVHTLEILLRNKVVNAIDIKCVKLFTDDPEDTLFGTMVLRIYYTSTEISNEVASATIVSENMRDKKEDYFKEIKRKLKEEYGVKNVNVDEDGFVFLLQSMEIKLNKWIKKNKAKAAQNNNKVEPMIPNDLKDSVKDIADRVIEKINKDKK